MTEAKDMGEELSGVKIEVAELRGAVLSEIRHLGEDMKALALKMDGVPTRREHEVLVERVAKLESFQAWLNRAVLGAWIAGIATVFTFGRKIF